MGRSHSDMASAARDDVKRSLDELSDDRTVVYAKQLRPLVRVLGSIAVTLALMLDHSRNNQVSYSQRED